MVFLGLAFLFLQTRQVELMPNSSILASSDHITISSGSSRCSLANFRRACTCAFFSRGTLFFLVLCSVLRSSFVHCSLPKLAVFLSIDILFLLTLPVPFDNVLLPCGNSDLVKSLNSTLACASWSLHLESYSCRGVGGKTLDCYTEGPGFGSQPRYSIC